MIWTVLALLSLVVLGGFISYYGDLQGRRWGKRRVTWFGMRPKHTAILITSLTGAFISLLSVITLLLISPTVREVVLRGERAIEQYKIVKAQYDESVRRAKADYADYRRRIADATQQYTQAQQGLATAQNRVSRLELHAQSLNRQIEQDSKIEADLVRTQAVLKQKNGLLVGLNRKLDGENRGLSKRNLELAQLNLRLQTVNADLRVQNTTLSKQNGTLSKQNSVLFGTNRQLLQDNQQTLQAAQKLQENLRTKQMDLAHVTADLMDKNQELEAETGKLAGYGLGYVQLSKGRISVRVGAELARRTLDANMSADAIRTQLKQLLQDASKLAQHYGAAIGTNGRAVQIASKLVPSLTSTEEVGEEESLNALISNLEGHNKQVVVVVRAVSNTVEGEQVGVDLTSYDVTPMFEPGQVFASTHIDANQPEEQVRQAIAEFLQTDVRAAVVKAGAIPQVDPSSGTSQIGQFDPFDLIRLVMQARRLHGEVVMRAVAVERTTSADPLDRQHLKLDFQKD